MYFLSIGWWIRELSKNCCIILAAGEGKRMNSGAPKVLSKVLFKPMLRWIIDAVSKSSINKICVVKGFQHEVLQKYLDGLDVKCESVLQSERKGTAHAVMTAKAFLERYIEGDVLILGGDSPFIDSNTILESYKKHKKFGNSATIVSSKVSNPHGYGRILRCGAEDRLIDIVEERDASLDQKKIKEINSGAYWFKVKDLLSHLFRISDNTSQNEYYLTSIVKLFIEEGFKVDAFETESSDIVLGANDSAQLEDLNLIARNKIIESLVENGVEIPCRDGVVVSVDAIVDKGATILPNTMILGKSVISSGAVVGPNSQVLDSKIGKGAVFNSSYCENVVVKENEKIGPFEILKNDNIFSKV